MNEKSEKEKPERIPSNHPQGVRGELSLLHGKVASLGKEVERVTEIVDSNATIYSDSFSALETQIHILQRAISDALCGGEFHVLRNEETGRYRIDIQSYLVEYAVCMSLGEWVRTFLELDKVAAAPETPPAEEADHVVEFGG